MENMAIVAMASKDVRMAKVIASRIGTRSLQEFWLRRSQN